MGRVRTFLFFLIVSFSTKAATLAIRHVTLIDMTGGPVLEDRTVVVNGERIAQIGPAATTTIPKDAIVVDGAGKYLIPGLWDMHVHLWHRENLLPLYAAFGITGVRDMGSDFERTKTWREKIETGKAIGPRIVTCGPVLSSRDSGDEKLPTIVVNTPRDARKAFDQLYDMDVDFIKVLSIPRDAYFALAEQSRHWKVPFAGHVPQTVTAWEAMSELQASMEHLLGLFLSCSSEEAKLRALSPDKIGTRMLDTFSEAKALEILARSAQYGTRQTPTLTFWMRTTHADDDHLTADPRLKYVPESIRKTWPDPRKEASRLSDIDRAELGRQLVLAFRMVGLMPQSEVQILAGTDTGDPYTIPGATLHDELELLVKAGLTPLQALKSATVAPAKFLHQEDTTGTIEKGKVADLVLLQDSPLENIANTQSIAAVVLRGKYLPRQKLDEILAAAK